MYKDINNLKLYYYGRVSFQNIPNIKDDICLLKIDAVSRRKFEIKKNNRLDSIVKIMTKMIICVIFVWVKNYWHYMFKTEFRLIKLNIFWK